MCGLGYYGGFPDVDTCVKCIKNKWNTKERAEELFELEKKTHPQTVDRISGCCDSARNYIDR